MTTATTQKIDLKVPEVDLTGTAAIVTGGTDGLGKATVVQLALRGARVIIAGRNAEKGRKVVEEVKAATGRGDVDIIFEICSLDNLQSVKDFADRMTTYFTTPDNPPLKLFYCNAGVAMTPYKITQDGFENHFQTNYLSHFYLILRLYPLLAPSTPGSGPGSFTPRIIKVSSEAHRVFQYSKSVGGPILFDKLNDQAVYGMSKAYGQSKAAQILMSTELARRIPAAAVPAEEEKEDKHQHPKVYVGAIHPGVVATNITSGGSTNKVLLSVVNGILGVLAKSADGAVSTQLYVGVAKEIEDAAVVVAGHEKGSNTEGQTGSDSPAPTTTANKRQSWFPFGGKKQTDAARPVIPLGAYFVPDMKLAQADAWTRDPELSQKLWDFSLGLLREKLGDEAVVVPEELSNRVR
ncbi:hypothetical protein HK102_005217 [Quaeritorhiza haematococci]|nr:hypothetical protein HK102_005217 [Quaeritorhiza haematococci]